MLIKITGVSILPLVILIIAHLQVQEIHSWSHFHYHMQLDFTTTSINIVSDNIQGVDVWQQGNALFFRDTIALERGYVDFDNIISVSVIILDAHIYIQKLYDDYGAIISLDYGTNIFFSDSVISPFYRYARNISIIGYVVALMTFCISLLVLFLKSKRKTLHPI